jgi:hypothetical protein
MLFELFKEELLLRYDGDPPHVAIVGAGMLSSSIAQVVSYPLALIRTRLQVGSPATLASRLGLAWLAGAGVCGCARAGTCSRHWTSGRCPVAARLPPRTERWCALGGLQAQGAGGRPIKYSGMSDVFWHTMRKEGIFGFYKVCGGGGGGGGGCRPCCFWC